MKKTPKGNSNFYPLRATFILSHIWGFNHISLFFYDHFSNYFLRKNVHYLTIFKSIYFFEWRKNSCFRKLPLSTAHFKVTSCIYIMEIKRVSPATSSKILQTNFLQHLENFHLLINCFINIQVLHWCDPRHRYKIRV